MFMKFKINKCCHQETGGGGVNMVKYMDSMDGGGMYVNKYVK